MRCLVAIQARTPINKKFFNSYESGRPMTGAGFPMVYEKELADNSQALKRLGELQLHNLLMEMKAEGLIDCGEHEGNRWFARYG